MRPRLEPRPRLRAARCVAALASALLVCACSTLKHGYTTADYAGQTLAVKTHAGSERLQLEMEYDGAVRDCVKTNGRPDHLHVADRAHLYLFYPQRDLVVVIKRGLIPPGEVVMQTPIPGHFFRLLPKAEVAGVQAKRAARKAARPAARRRPARAAPPAAPRAASSGTGLSLSTFDLDTMVARFRKPLSAADAGVSGWRVATLADGTRAGVARFAKTEYRIQPDVISASTPIQRLSRSAPSGARLGYVRVNRAVFGTRAHSISESVSQFVSLVAADPSGKTRIVRRVAGRTVSVTRDSRRGLLVYGVHAD